MPLHYAAGVELRIRINRKHEGVNTDATQYLHPQLKYIVENAHKHKTVQQVKEVHAFFVCKGISGNSGTDTSGSIYGEREREKEEIHR